MKASCYARISASAIEPAQHPNRQEREHIRNEHQIVEQDLDANKPLQPPRQDCGHKLQRREHEHFWGR